MARFPNEKILSDELCKITEALEAKDVDTNSIFLKSNITLTLFCSISVFICSIHFFRKG